MKATLTFNLPEDNSEWRRIQQCDALHSAMWKFQEALIKMVNKEDTTMGESEKGPLRQALTQFLLEMEIEGVTLDHWS